MQNELEKRTLVGNCNLQRSNRLQNVQGDDSTRKSVAKIDVIRAGDRIESITITCGCGETHTIDCEYE